MQENVKIGGQRESEPPPEVCTTEHNTGCNDRKKDVQGKQIDLLRVAR